MKKLNLTRIIKAIIFFGIAYVFLQATFYEISKTSSIGYPFVENYVILFFDEYFKQTWHNYALSVLFVLLGALELKEGVIDGN